MRVHNHEGSSKQVEIDDERTFGTARIHRSKFHDVFDRFYNSCNSTMNGSKRRAAPTGTEPDQIATNEYAQG